MDGGCQVEEEEALGTGTWQEGTLGTGLGSESPNSSSLLKS